MDTDSIIQLVFIIILLLLSAFFSSAETAFTTVNRIKIRSLIESGSKRAMTVDRIIENKGKMLSAILIGNNDSASKYHPFRLLPQYRSFQTGNHYSPAMRIAFHRQSLIYHLYIPETHQDCRRGHPRTHVDNQHSFSANKSSSFSKRSKGKYCIVFSPLLS